MIRAVTIAAAREWLIRRLVLACLLLALGGSLHAQSLVTIVVQDGTKDQPLPNAEVVLVPRTSAGLTNARGEVRVPWEPGTTLRVLVRQIGFAPLDTTLTEHPGSSSVVVRLAAMSYELPGVLAQSDQCPRALTPAQGQRTAAIMEQLQIGADHFVAFKRQYKWDVWQARLTWNPKSREKLKEMRRRREWMASTELSDAAYDPGNVYAFRGRHDWEARLFSVDLLASEKFVKAHCFTALSPSPTDSMPTVRLAFSPLPRITSPDWRGVITLDSATAELRRIEFKMTGEDGYRSMARFEGVTYFIRVSPYVMMPLQTTVQWWWKKPKKLDWPLPDGRQIIRAREMHWEGDRPPEAEPVTLLPAYPAIATSAEPPPPSSP